MTRSLSKPIEAFEKLTPGQIIEKTQIWTASQSDLFSQLTEDYAPVHRDADMASNMGFHQPILYGFLLISGFSDMVGCVMPGPQSVIHKVSFDFVQPTLVDDVLLYKLEIIRLSPAVKTVILKATITRDNGDLIVQGKIQCGFPQ